MGIAAEVIDYLGGLTVTQGRLAGTPLTLLPWQRRFVKGAFAPDVIAAALTVARGNGKSTLVAGLTAAALDGPLAVSRAETVVVASSFEQSRIVFGHTLAVLRQELFGGRFSRAAVRSVSGRGCSHKLG